MICRKWLSTNSKAEREAFFRLSTEVRDHAKGNTKNDEENPQSGDRGTEYSNSENEDSGILGNLAAGVKSVQFAKE